MIKVILATTDGSASAQKALDLATDMAIKYNARLILFHVIGQGEVPDELRHMAEVEHIVDPPEVDPSRLSGGIPLDEKTAYVDQQIHANIGENLIRHAEQTAKSKGVKNIQALMEHGDPAEKILQAAKTHNADLIVMGSRGLGLLKGLLVGSVSQKVHTLSECTFISVK